MGRIFYNSVPQTFQSNITKDYDDSNSTFDADGYLTGYTSEGIVISNITYETSNGTFPEYSGTYKRVTGWDELNSETGILRSITVVYDDSTGRVLTTTAS